MMKEATVAFKGLEFQPFTQQDIEALTPIMKRAFDYDTKIHTDKSEGGPPGYDDGGFFREWYLHKGVTAFKILKDGRAIGGIALWINANNINYLGNIFIDPELQDQGLGSIVWAFVEHNYPAAIKWQTDTPAFSRRNHHFYVNKCGFKIIQIKNPKSTDETCAYILEKEMAVR